MFEKGAEEWFEKLKQAKVPYTYENVNKQLHKAFKDGAEFGYNKANEWNYVSEKGTPKAEGHYLVCLRNKDKDILDCWILYDKDVGWYSMQIRIKDIYAWKEIVPPKEITE